MAILAAAAALLGAGFALLLLRPSDGTLIVSVSGAGNSQARVFVDGSERCQSVPCRVDALSAGPHHVRVTAGALSAQPSDAVYVVAGEERRLDVMLAAAKPSAVAATPLPAKEQADVPQRVTIRLGQEAQGAEVYVSRGGEEVLLMELPATITVARDERVKIVANKHGYEPFEQSLAWMEGTAERTVTIALSANGANGAQGSRPTPPRTPTAPAPGRPEASPPAAGGTLNINSLPVSSILLDGRPVGKTPKMGLPVAAGPHTVVFVHPDGTRKVVSVTVAAGATATAATQF
jgi:serine/threonine-protein kinase